MAKGIHPVELTASFLEHLADTEVFLTESDASLAFDALVAALRETVVPNLAKFPRIGRRYLDCPPQSAEALAELEALRVDAASALREYVHDEYLLLYTVAGADSTVYLLSIRHHRQLSFDLARLWPGPQGGKQR